MVFKRRLNTAGRVNEEKQSILNKNALENDAASKFATVSGTILF